MASCGCARKQTGRAGLSPGRDNDRKPVALSLSPPTNNAERYCIDAQTSAAMTKVATFQMDGEEYTIGDAHHILHVWPTAGEWAGPVGDFRLEVETGDLPGAVAVCADGLTRVSTAADDWRARNIVPDRDLELLILRPATWDEQSDRVESQPCVHGGHGD